jgi:hypothetical protein
MLRTLLNLYRRVKLISYEQEQRNIVLAYGHTISNSDESE